MALAELVTADHLAFASFADQLDVYCRERYKYKSKCVFARYHTVDVGRAAVEFYLRFRVGASWPDGSVVIARIAFRKQRRGNGKALLEQLVKMAPFYGYRNVEVEQTGDDPSIQAFVRKFGFINSSDERNWITSVDQLRDVLASMSEHAASHS